MKKIRYRVIADPSSVCIVPWFCIGFESRLLYPPLRHGFIAAPRYFCRCVLRDRPASSSVLFIDRAQVGDDRARLPAPVSPVVIVVTERRAWRELSRRSLRRASATFALRNTFFKSFVMCPATDFSFPSPDQKKYFGFEFDTASNWRATAGGILLLTGLPFLSRRRTTR